MKNKEDILNNKKDKREVENNRGVYFLIKNNEIVYVGKSEHNIFDRIKAHKKTKDFDYYSYELIEDKEVNLDTLESNYIGQFTPIYNKTISDFDNFKQLATTDDLGFDAKNQKLKLDCFILNGKLYVNYSDVEENLNLE